MEQRTYQPLAREALDRIQSQEVRDIELRARTCLRCGEVAHQVFRIVQHGNGCYRRLVLTRALEHNYCRRCGNERIQELGGERVR